jgi:hypothetical protein
MVANAASVFCDACRNPHYVYDVQRVLVEKECNGVDILTFFCSAAGLEGKSSVRGNI